MISHLKLLLRSLRFHARSHLGVILGAAIGSAALIGALVVGDSVRHSLRQRALDRIGLTRHALDSSDRLFTPSLGESLLPSGAALHLSATVSRQDGAALAHRVHLYGTTDSFWKLAPRPGDAPPPRPEPGKVSLNSALASQLHARPGDSLVLRFAKPSALSQDAALNPGNESSVALRLQVQDIVPAADFGDFSLTSGARPALNAFVHLSDLWTASGLTNRINLLLLATEADANLRLATHWTLEDAQLLVHAVPELPASPSGSPPPPMVELASPRIFLDPPVVAAALGLSTPPVPPHPDLLNTPGPNTTSYRATPILTYLVNALRHGDRLTPYSMVTAAGPPWTPPDLADDQIVLTDWLARDLDLRPGDSLELTFFDPEAGARLIERTHVFRVHSVVPLAGLHADRSLMPHFPGLANAEKTADWDAGFPLVHKIRDQDEAYWQEHRGTPKAYISPTAGARLWANRFGSATAVRFLSANPGSALPSPETIARDLRARLQPADVGLAFQPVREQALTAASSGQDFGQLFIGFSFFLVLAALLLMGLLFQFGLEQRLPEIGTLLAVGLTRPAVRRLWWFEGSFLALLGGVLGVAGGLAYAAAMIRGLNTLWSAAVAGTGLQFHATPASVAIGLVASVIVGAGTIALTLRRQFRRPIRELLQGEITSPSPRANRRAGTLGVLAALSALALLAFALVSRDTANPLFFFGAGSLLLIAGLAFLAAWLGRLRRAQPASATSGPTLSLRQFAVVGTARRRNRSLATAALLASGTFLIAALGAFRMDAQRGAWHRTSGTGGFALIGESSSPITRDLNSAAGLEFYGLDPADLPGVRVVPFRVRDGDEASCLNLDRAQRPRILGVQPRHLADRGAFSFAQVAEGVPSTNAWLGLTLPTPVPGQVPNANPNPSIPEIPAIGDAASIQWALGSKVGGTLDLTDERGRPFRLRLIAGVANSILQGNLVIDETAFNSLFPGESGYRFFLIDTPTQEVDAVAATLSRALQDEGLELTPATRRLAQFNAVQNTYLSTFQILGGLGLLLGSAGLGVVVLRNVLERRGELALLAAVGFRPPLVSRLVLWEHAALLVAGLAIGVISALVAVLPALIHSAADLPLPSLASTLAGVLLLGLATTAIATRASLRGRLLDALRGE